MVGQLGEPERIPCVDAGCFGWLVGTFGGAFMADDARWYQYLNCQCDECGGSWPEVFEVAMPQNYYVTPYLEMTDPQTGLTYGWLGFGMPVAEIPDPIAFIQEGISCMRLFQRTSQPGKEFN